MLALALSILALGAAVWALTRNHAIERTVMATKAEVTELVSEFNDATNAVEVRVARLEELVKAAGLNEADETELFAELRGIRTRLRGLGADPATPIPPEPTPAPPA